MRLEARRLGFGYPGKPVGRDVDLAIGPGEVVCLLGPNGSGKTTLFKTLLGLLPAQAGEVWIDDRPLEGLPRAEVARRVAYVPQAHAEIDAAADRLARVAEAETPRLEPHAQPCRPRVSSHRNTGAPTNAVRMPIGVSTAAIVRASVSTRSR